MAAKFDVEELIAEQVEAIDEAIARIDKRMGPYEKLAAKKQQLLAARRALLGTGTRVTSGNSRLTLDDILQYLKENPGNAPGQLAERFGVTQGTISSHLHRNKDRFINKDGRYWVRDPKNGLNTAEDIEEEED